MKSICFHSKDRLPTEHRQDADYFVAWNDHRIAVGDRLKFKNMDGETVTVVKLWLVIGPKILEDNVMEVGHDYIARFDRSIGRVEADIPYYFEKV